LETIAQAIFVLELIEKGITSEELAEEFEGNYSITGGYLAFFLQAGMIDQQDGVIDKKWHLTDSGLFALDQLRRSMNGSR
jgi:predicted transcriptional regulator